MELSKLVYLAVAALAAGIVMFFASSKERNEKGEWGNGLQWAYLLMMIGVFGILALWVEWSLTAVLLAFTVFTGAVWLWAKLVRGKGQPEKAARELFDTRFVERALQRDGLMSSFGLQSLQRQETFAL